MEFLTYAQHTAVQQFQRNMQRYREQVAQHVEAAGPDIVFARMMEVDNTYPMISQDLKAAYAMSDMEMSDLEELARAEAQLDPAVGSDRGFFGMVGNALKMGMVDGAWGQVVKPVMRGALLGLDALAHESQRVITSGQLALAEGRNMGESMAEYGSSTLVAGISQAARGEGFDVGTGIMPGGAAQIEAHDSRTLEVRGERAHAGRALASGLLDTPFLGTTILGGVAGVEAGMKLATGGEQGYTNYIAEVNDSGGWAERGYDTAASLLQLGVDIGLDPTASAAVIARRALIAKKGLTGEGTRTLGAAIRTVSPQDANKAREAVEAHRGLNTWASANVDEVVRLGFKDELLEKIATSDALELNLLLKMERVGPRQDYLARMLRAWGDTKTKEEVAELLLHGIDDTGLGAIGTSVGMIQRGPLKGQGFARTLNPFPRRIEKALEEGGLGQNVYGPFAPAPERIISADSPLRAAANVDSMLRAAKVPMPQRSKMFDKVLAADDNGTLSNNVIEAIGMIEDAHILRGGSAEEMRLLMNTYMDMLNSYATTSHSMVQGKHVLPHWLQDARVHRVTDKISGEVIETIDVAPSLMIHARNSGVPLLDLQTIRRATNRSEQARKLYETTGWQQFDRVLRQGTKAFKFLALFTRPAYAVRNNLENLGRSAGAGYASAFSDPLTFASLVRTDFDKMRLPVFSDKPLRISAGQRFTVRPDSVENLVGPEAFARFDPGERVYAKIEKIGDQGDTLQVRLSNAGEREVVEATVKRSDIMAAAESVQDGWMELADAAGLVTRNAAGMHDRPALVNQTVGYRPYHPHDSDFIEVWATQLQSHAADPFVRAAANPSFRNVDEMVDHLIDSGAVARYAERLGKEAREAFYSNGFPDRAAIHRYMEETAIPILRDLTQDDIVLREAIGTGLLRGSDDFLDPNNASKIASHVRGLQSEGIQPAAVSGPIQGMRPLDSKGVGEILVDVIGNRPEMFFTRNPLGVQLFLDNIAQAFPAMRTRREVTDLYNRTKDALRQGMDDVSAAGQARIFKKLDESYNSTMKRFDDIAVRDPKTGKELGEAILGPVTDADMVVEIAMMRAADRTLEIAFDASQRSNIQEMFDVLMPFYDAWAEIAKSWGKVVRDNPSVLGRGYGAYSGVRGQGMVFQDEFGTERFQYAGGEWLSQALRLPGVRAALAASTSGLNLIAQSMGPGFGPVLQWGTDVLMPDTADTQWVRDAVMPYGFDPKTSFMPAWFNKMLNVITEGAWDEKAWTDATGDALRALGASGEYDLENPDDILRLEDDTKKAARWATFLQTATQWIAPTGPKVEWDIENDETGEWHRLTTMVSAFHEMVDGAGGDVGVAQAAFWDLYGIEPYWVQVGKTSQVTPGPRTLEGTHWIADHQELARKYSDVIGYFAPPDDPGEPPDYQTHMRRIRTGEIHLLTPEQMIRLTQQQKAYAILHAQRKKTDNLPHKHRTAAMSAVRGWLDDMYPGWQSDVPGIPKRLDRDTRIKMLETALQDDKLRQASPVTGPLMQYMSLRREVQDMLRERKMAGGAGGLGADANHDLRSYLADQGGRIADQFPEFRGVWNSLLFWEVR